MQIITPKALECDAIVPQCLDNQYTSDAVLDEMLGVGPSAASKLFDDTGIRQARLEETHAEFIRSLLYSSTVVVNRAYLVNSDYLVGELLPQDTAIPKLMREKAIIPFLQREKSLTEEAQYAQQKAGVKRLRELEDQGAFEGVRCLRFSEDDKTNDGHVRKLAANFRQFSQDLKSVVESVELAEVAANFYVPVTPEERGGKVGVPPDVLTEFEGGLKDISRFVFDGRVTLGRQDIYGEFFIQDGLKTPENVAKGLFRAEMRRPAWRMLKKLIDLKYNANLPDQLGRYTLTPANLPGRSALPWEPPPDSNDTNDAFKKLRELKGRIMDQKPTILPRLKEVKLDKVLEIRALEEWQSFRASQEHLLTASHDGIVGSFERYHRDLLAFQERLGAWAVHSARESVEGGSVCETAMNLTVKVGEFTLFVALDHLGRLTGLNPLEHLGPVAATMAAEVAWEMSKDQMLKLLERHVGNKIMHWSAELVVQVSDRVRNRIDKDHSYQLNLIKSNAEITRAELVDMIQEIQHASKISATASTQFAEQSK